MADASFHDDHVPDKDVLEKQLRFLQQDVHVLSESLNHQIIPPFFADETLSDGGLINADSTLSLEQSSRRSQVVKSKKRALVGKKKKTRVDASVSGITIEPSGTHQGKLNRLEKALKTVTLQRDAANERVRQVSWINERMAVKLREYERLKAENFELRRDYEALQATLASSERIREQQKQLILTLESQANSSLSSSSSSSSLSHRPTGFTDRPNRVTLTPQPAFMALSPRKLSTIASRTQDRRNGNNNGSSLSYTTAAVPPPPPPPTASAATTTTSATSAINTNPVITATPTPDPTFTLTPGQERFNHHFFGRDQHGGDFDGYEEGGFLVPPDVSAIGGLSLLSSNHDASHHVHPQHINHPHPNNPHVHSMDIFNASEQRAQQQQHQQQRYDGGGSNVGSSSSSSSSRRRSKQQQHAWGDRGSSSNRNTKRTTSSSTSATTRRPKTNPADFSFSAPTQSWKAGTRAAVAGGGIGGGGGGGVSRTRRTTTTTSSSTSSTVDSEGRRPRRGASAPPRPQQREQQLRRGRGQTARKRCGDKGGTTSAASGWR